MNQIKYKVLPPFEMRMKMAHLQSDAYVPVGSQGRFVDAFLAKASYEEKVALFGALQEDDRGDLSKAFARLKTAAEDSEAEDSEAEDEMLDSMVAKGSESTKKDKTDKDLKSLVAPMEDDDDDFFEEDGEID